MFANQEQLYGIVSKATMGEEIAYIEEVTSIRRDAILKVCRDSPLLTRDKDTIYIKPTYPDKEPEGNSALVLQLLRDYGVYDPSKKEYPHIYKMYQELYKKEPPKKQWGDEYPPLTRDSFTALYRKLRRVWFFAINWN
jgi:hypothetical protein